MHNVIIKTTIKKEEHYKHKLISSNVKNIIVFFKLSCGEILCTGWHSYTTSPSSITSVWRYIDITPPPLYLCVNLSRVSLRCVWGTRMGVRECI